MNNIEIGSEVHRFIQHLRDNKRIIFSAKFGDGKTYFLNKVREAGTNAGEFFFVTLYPVNYSVAPNEDIFEYIKRDILLQFKEEDRLFNTDVEAIFDSVLNPKSITDIVSFLISFLPEGEKLNRIIDTAIKWHARRQNVDKGFSKYNSYFKNQKGGIYEEDAYTKYIQRIVKDIHNEEYREDGDKKKVVLIIEDLDRLDPAHLFRLLNVISAHIDQDKDTNKFGFDNIVLVMDYDCTQHIFNHFYGEKSNFVGYMSKFSSNYVYHYSIHDIAVNHLYSYFQSRCNLTKEKISQMIVKEALTSNDKTITLSDMIESLSVRDIAACLDNPEISIKTKTLLYKFDDKISITAITPLTCFIAVLMRIDKNSQIKKSQVLTMLQGIGLHAINICKEYLYSLGLGDGSSPIVFQGVQNVGFVIERTSKKLFLGTNDLQCRDFPYDEADSPEFSKAIMEAFIKACRSIPDFEVRRY